MNTNVDDEFDIPEITDFSGFGPGRYTRQPGETMEILLDGAVGYSLRLTPSNKILGRFTSTLEAWPAVIDAIDAGRPKRCLILDAELEDGSTARVSSGMILEFLARSGMGFQPDSTPAHRRRPAAKEEPPGAAVVTRPGRRARAPRVAARSSRG
jgi:hypothetical protein